MSENKAPERIWIHTQTNAERMGAVIAISYTPTEAGVEYARVDPSPATPELDDYVAWCRYTHEGTGRYGEGLGTIETCDSDAEGAFKVYRATPASHVDEERIAEIRALRMAIAEEGYEKWQVVPTDIDFLLTAYDELRAQRDRLIQTLETRAQRETEMLEEVAARARLALKEQATPTADEGLEDCGLCNGEGRIYFHESWRECQRCGGSGKFVAPSGEAHAATPADQGNEQEVFTKSLDEAQQDAAKRRARIHFIQHWCDHCSADLNDSLHILCDADYSLFEADEAKRAELPSNAPKEPAPADRVEGEQLSFSDAVRIARGCTDYGGGYRNNDHKMVIYQHGIQTVINSLEAAEKLGLKNTQVSALHRMGAAEQPVSQEQRETKMGN